MLHDIYNNCVLNSNKVPEKTWYIFMFGCPAFKTQVLSLSTVNCWGNFRIFLVSLGNVSAQKKSRKLQRNLCILCWQYGSGIPQHFAEDYDLFFAFLIWDYLFYLNYIVYLQQTRTCKQKEISFLLISLFCFLYMCLLQWENSISNATWTWCSKYSSIWKPS